MNSLNTNVVKPVLKEIGREPPQKQLPEGMTARLAEL